MKAGGSIGQAQPPSPSSSTITTCASAFTLDQTGNEASASDFAAWQRQAAGLVPLPTPRSATTSVGGYEIDTRGSTVWVPSLGLHRTLVNPSSNAAFARNQCTMAFPSGRFWFQNRVVSLAHRLFGYHIRIDSKKARQQRAVHDSAISPQFVWPVTHCAHHKGNRRRQLSAGRS